MAKRIQFTSNDLDMIRKLYTEGTPILKIAERFHVDFSVISDRLKKMGIFQYKGRRWSAKEIEFLKGNYANTEWEYILKNLNRWKKPEIISKASQLHLKREVYFWSDRDIQILRESYNQKLSLKEISKLLDYKFSEMSIASKASSLGIIQREKWSDAEDQLLREIYHIYDMDQICDTFHTRTRDAIIRHAISLGLSYKTTWTHDEIRYLMDHYQVQSDEEIGRHLNRSADSVRGKRFQEKLYRPVSDSSYNYIGEYIRKRNREWKKESARSCNYKCAITGERFQAIHHLVGLNLILQETLNELGYEDNVGIDDLDQDTLERITQYFFVVQNRYPLGVCLTEKIHKQFHDEYGYGNNTVEQFTDFLKKHHYKLHNISKNP